MILHRAYDRCQARCILNYNTIIIMKYNSKIQTDVEVSSLRTLLNPLRSIHETTATAGLGNLDRTELPLAGGVAIFAQTVLLLCGNMLLRTHDTTVLIKHEVALSKSTGGLVGSIMPDLCARTF